MNCPICDNDISQQGDDSINEMLEMGKTILSFCHPLGLAKNTFDVGKAFYYEIKNFPSTTSHSRCKKCGNYIFECPHCSRYTPGGITHPALGQKYTCQSCKKVFAYTSPRPSDTDAAIMGW